LSGREKLGVRNLHFVTVASDPHFGLDRLRDSALYYGLKLEVLGLGQPFLGKGSKFLYLAEFAAGLPPDDVVVFTDAYDSVFLAGEEQFQDVLSRFEHDLVISAEQNFFLRGHPLFFLWQNLPPYLAYPPAPKPYRFLNSGTLAATAGRLAGLCEEATITPDIDSDQTALSRYYRHHPEALALDHRQELAACNGGRVGMEAHDYTWVEGRLRNNLTGTSPCILHVPGKNEESMSRILEGAPFASTRTPTAEERRLYHRRARLHRVVCTLGLDNFLARFLSWNTLLVLALLILSAVLL